MDADGVAEAWDGMGTPGGMLTMLWALGETMLTGSVAFCAVSGGAADAWATTAVAST